MKVVHENYRAVTPPLRDLSSLGFNIWMECSDYDTYKLVREGEPVGELRALLTALLTAILITFSALTLSLGCHDEHPSCKN